MQSSTKLIKTGLIAIPAIIALTATAPSFAEFRVGAEVGWSSTSADVFGISAGSESGGTFGVFGQWRFDVSDATDLGIHLGYAADSTDGIDSTYDLLGLVAWQGTSFNPFIMAGYSNISFDDSDDSGVTLLPDITGDDSASGWKIAVGTEFPLSESLIGHVVLDYADYGDVLGLLGTDKTSIRFGVGYSF